MNKYLRRLARALLWALRQPETFILIEDVWDAVKDRKLTREEMERLRKDVLGVIQARAKGRN